MLYGLLSLGVLGHTFNRNVFGYFSVRTVRLRWKSRRITAIVQRTKAETPRLIIEKLRYIWTKLFDTGQLFLWCSEDTFHPSPVQNCKFHEGRVFSYFPCWSIVILRKAYRRGSSRFVDRWAHHQKHQWNVVYLFGTNSHATFLFCMTRAEVKISM